MERVNHENAMHIIAVARTEDTRVQGADAGAGQHPANNSDQLSALFPLTTKD